MCSETALARCRQSNAVNEKRLFAVAHDRRGARLVVSPLLLRMCVPQFQIVQSVVFTLAFRTKFLHFIESAFGQVDAIGKCRRVLLCAVCVEISACAFVGLCCVCVVVV